MQENDTSQEQTRQEIDLLTSRCRDQQSALELLRTNIRNRQDAIAELVAELERQDSRQQDAQAEIDAQKRRLEELDNQIAGLEAELEELLEKARVQIVLLHGQLHEGAGGVLRALLPALHAQRMALDDVGGSRCVLLGVLKGLPITAIRGDELRERGVEQEPGFVDVASRLIRCQERYGAIFKNLLGRTVVVEDLDCGIAMARKYQNRFRIVTLDGQVINRGGSMTGGSVSRSAGVLSRANELTVLKDRLNVLTESLAAAQREKDEAGRELSGREAASASWVPIS